jgi:uncharacterized protein YkwD
MYPIKMKKILLSLGVIFFSLTTISSTQAISIESFTTSIDQATAKKGSTANQISFLKGLQSLLQTPTFKNSEYDQIFSELARYAGEKAQTLQNQPSSSTPSSPSTTPKPSDGTNYITIPNVDSARVKDTVLSRHNQERQSRGLDPYGYHSDLEKSAQLRADTLKNEERLSNTHARNPGDGYYNYNSITEWFKDLGIVFPIAG